MEKAISLDSITMQKQSANFRGELKPSRASWRDRIQRKPTQHSTRIEMSTGGALHTAVHMESVTMTEKPASEI